jgi:DNA-binding transcriptional MerR regulator
MFKQAIFIKHLPYIEQKIDEGYKLSEIVMLLKLEHNFDMKTTSNLSNYLCRFRNKSAAQTEKKAEEIIVKSSIPITQHQPQPQQQELQDDEIDIDIIKQLEAELSTDRNNCYISKSLIERV